MSSVAVKAIEYTRPLPPPARSARRSTVPLSLISASGHVLPSRRPSTGSSEVTLLIVMVTSPPSGSVTRLILTRLKRWFGGHRTSREASARVQSGGKPTAQLVGAVKSADSVREHPGWAEKLAVTLTGAPLAASPVSVTVCGLTPIAND